MTDYPNNISAKLEIIKDAFSCRFALTMKETA